MNPETPLLQAGAARLLLNTETGGSILRYWNEGAAGAVEWLRAGPAQGGGSRDPGAMGCFPLVPYSNRIRDGRFRFAGREIALPLNFGDHPHSIHGHGWQAPWKMVARADHEVTLEYLHPPDAWPFAYRARQVFRLEPARLSVTLTLENLGAAPMPAGLGFHPYFPRTPLTRLTASVDQVWLTDREVMPTQRVAPPPEWDLNRGLLVDRTSLDSGPLESAPLDSAPLDSAPLDSAPLDSAPLDNVFTGWNHSAVIEWPERQCCLTLAGGEGLDFLVVYSPRSQPFFCAEPVSHATDAFNRAAAGERDTGMRVLAPGESWAVTMELRPEQLG